MDARMLAGALVVAMTACGQMGTDGIAASHIAANVPGQIDFDRLLRRDLQQYFATSVGRPVAVEYELLRSGPTQTGIAYPKFYAWVRVVEKGSVLRQGAVRLAAIARERFDVTDFVSADEARANPERLRQVFPGPVCDRISERLVSP